MAYFNENFVEHRRKQWLRSISAVEVQANGAWHRGEFNSKKIEGDTIKITATFPSLDAVACTIIASRLIDVRGEVAAYQGRIIEKVRGQGCMIQITIPIYEVSL